MRYFVVSMLFSGFEGVFKVQKGDTNSPGKEVKM